MVFAWFAYDYVNQNNGDAVRYWFVGANLSNISWMDFLHPGTDTIKFITYPLVKYFHIPPLVGCLFFSAWSGYGLIRLWNLVKPYLTLTKIRMVAGMLFLLLPNVHFWTSLIGKEAFLFLPMVLVTEKIYQKKYLHPFLILSVFLICWIRPHLGVVILVSFFLAFFWKSKVSLKMKAFIMGILLGLGSLSYWGLIQITKAQEGLWHRIERYYWVHNLKLKKTSAYVPLEDYSYPYKLFTFYFRPLPFEKSGFLYAVVSFENLIMLGFMGLFLYGFWKYFHLIKHNVFLIFALSFLLLHGTMYAYAYANFGLIIRTKSLIFPFLVFMFLVLLDAKAIFEKEKRI